MKFLIKSLTLENTARVFNSLLFLGCVAGFFAARESRIWFWTAVCLLIFNLLNIYFLFFQKRHSLLRNFGFLALLRYFFENIGPELRQYFYSGDTEEKPFNRTERADVYKQAKNMEKSSAFGSLLDFDGTALKLKHSFYPVEEEEVRPFRIRFGEERGISKPYTITKAVMISAMSYGALGKKAVQALSRGAKKAGVPLNTGEGGHPKYHLMEGADLIFQMGTAKFGVRTPGGDLDSDKLEKLSALKSVKMIEIKFSQGAKPGKGGLLPKEKITREIAELRGVLPGKDVISPPGHKECKDPESTVRFIRKIQEISGLPVGIKFCLGSVREMEKLLCEMKRQNIFPDYMAVDGSEGGTGAASKTFMDDLGFPLFPALYQIAKLSEKHKVKDKFKLLAAGKLIGAGKQMMALSMGADAVYTARGFMLAMGCLQALKCNNNTCPVGITTHSESLQKGLDIEEKSERVKNYVLNLNHHHHELLAALGKTCFSDLNKRNLIFPETGPGGFPSLADSV